MGEGKFVVGILLLPFRGSQPDISFFIRNILFWVNYCKLLALIFFYLPKPFNGIKRVSPKITMACLSHIRNNILIIFFEILPNSVLKGLINVVSNSFIKFGLWSLNRMKVSSFGISLTYRLYVVYLRNCKCPYLFGQSCYPYQFYNYP